MPPPGTKVAERVYDGKEARACLQPVASGDDLIDESEGQWTDFKAGHRHSDDQDWQLNCERYWRFQRPPWRTERWPSYPLSNLVAGLPSQFPRGLLGLPSAASSVILAARSTDFAVAGGGSVSVRRLERF